MINDVDRPDRDMSIYFHHLSTRGRSDRMYENIRLCGCQNDGFRVHRVWTNDFAIGPGLGI